ncbi:hypothetical protein [Falsibacillus albus]|uniref:hypothetical protein n=1 Tax=Falsibacillus albus TaxID=2478915 RepID=UPI001F46062D|nr:hypothetical protein [Falsibacillus albus]
MFYLLWLLGIVALIFVIVINIAKVYVVKIQANTSAEQAAIAGTAVLLEETKQAVQEFDSNLLLSAPQKLEDGGKSIADQIQEKQDDYTGNGYSESESYILAANDILPDKINSHPGLKHIFDQHFKSGDIGDRVLAAVQDIIDQNEGNTQNTVVEFSAEDWRLEVKSTVTFESITDHKFIQFFRDDIPQKGYGPKLKYLEGVYQ